jgi:hypothetical protein
VFFAPPVKGVSSAWWKCCLIHTELLCIFHLLLKVLLIPPSSWVALPSSSHLGTSTHSRHPQDTGFVTCFILAYDSRVWCCWIIDSTTAAAFLAAFGSSDSLTVVSWFSRDSLRHSSQLSLCCFWATLSAALDAFSLSRTFSRSHRGSSSPFSQVPYDLYCYYSDQNIGLTLYWLPEKSQMRTSKTHFPCTLFSQLYT